MYLIMINLQLTMLVVSRRSCSFLEYSRITAPFFCHMSSAWTSWISEIWLFMWYWRVMQFTVVVKHNLIIILVHSCLRFLKTSHLLPILLCKSCIRFLEIIPFFLQTVNCFLIFYSWGRLSPSPSNEAGSYSSTGRSRPPLVAWVQEQRAARR